MNGIMSPRRPRTVNVSARSLVALALTSWLGLGSASAQEAEAPLAPPAIQSETGPAEFPAEAVPTAKPVLRSAKPLAKRPTASKGNWSQTTQLIPTGPVEGEPLNPQAGRFGELTQQIPTRFNRTSQLVQKRPAAASTLWAAPDENEALDPAHPIRQAQAVDLVPGEGLESLPATEGDATMVENPPSVEFDRDTPAAESGRSPAIGEPAGFNEPGIGEAEPVPTRELPPQAVRNRQVSAAAPYNEQRTGEFSTEDEVHTVAGGESFWTISKKHYGQGRYSAALAEYNKSRIPKPDKIKPGMKVIVPSIDTLEAKFAPLISGVLTRTAQAPATPVKSGFFVDANGQPMYRVGEGDTLSDIAENHLGRSSRWTQIVQLNEETLPNPDAMKIGMLLRLPGNASDSLKVQ